MRQGESNRKRRVPVRPGRQARLRCTAGKRQGIQDIR
ncbi:MAG: phage DNA packaging protein J [Ruminiclostridium sp.]